VLPERMDPQARRRRRQAWTFVTLVSLVLVTGLVSLGHAMRWWTVGGEQVRSVRVPCPAETAEDPQDVTLGVYNATNRFGLARAVAREMQARGFRVNTITNDDSGRPVTAAAVVRHGPYGRLAAKSVAAQVVGPVTVVDDGRGSDTVDLVLGVAYKAMVPRPQASQAIAPVPTPVGCRRVTAGPAGPAAATTPPDAAPTQARPGAQPTTPPAAPPAKPTPAPPTASRSVLAPAPTTPPTAPGPPAP
jgi:hypothetical protein